jgi:hypothetical protein
MRQPISRYHQQRPAGPLPRRSGRHAGTTLLELMIALGIFTTLMSGVISLFVTSAHSWDRGSGKNDSDTAASLAVQQVIEELTEGKSATVGTDGSLTVQLPWLNDQNCYDRAFDGDLVKYYVSGGNLYRKVNTAPGKILTRGIVSATFTESNGMVTLAITAQAQVGQEVAQTRFNQTVTLRNRDVE